jgi:hypothetical protein
MTLCTVVLRLRRFCRTRLVARNVVSWCAVGRSLVTPLALAFIAAAGCVVPASEVLVVIGTDIDPSVHLTITATVTHGIDGALGSETHSWTRALPDGGIDGGIVLPASFAVEASATQPNDPLALLVEADAGGVPIRRRAQFTVTPHQTNVLRIFLSSRCVQPATGCSTASPCTVQAMCEEHGQTCGNDGTCVAVSVSLRSDLDGSFGDLPPPIACGIYHQACCAVGAACSAPLTCVAGRCQRCTDPGEVCCNGADLLADGTACGTAPDACHTAPTCRLGVCQSAPSMPNGTVCAPTMNPCRRDGVCTNGMCGAITDAPNGTACSAPTNPCHTPATCTAGACGAEGTQPDGHQWSGNAIDRCCGGNAVQVNSNSNCGVCGLQCRAGNCTTYNGHYFCPCVANSQCFAGCCRTYVPGNNLCVPGVCATGACAANCPGNGTCFQGFSQPNYCSY